MLKQAMRGGTIIINGDGMQTRDYVYVDDVVSAMVAASTAPDLDNLVINVGSGTEVCVRDLASLVIQVTGGKAEIVYNSRTDPGVSRLCADINLAHAKLNYQPHFSLAEGLKLTLDRDPRFRKDATRPLQPPSSDV
jgi:UDP-glucose 4-epimerase